MDIDQLQPSEFIECLDVSISYQPQAMALVGGKVTDAISLQSTRLSANNYKLGIDSECNKYINFNIFASGESTRSSLNNISVQKFIMINVWSQSPEGNAEKVVSENSLWSKIVNKEAKVSNDGTRADIQIKKVSSNFCIVTEVSLLGSNITNSPIYHKFSSDGDHSLAQHELSLLNSTGFGFDLTVTSSKNPLFNDRNVKLPSISPHHDGKKEADKNNHLGSPEDNQLETFQREYTGDTMPMKSNSTSSLQLENASQMESSIVTTVNDSESIESLSKEQVPTEMAYNKRHVDEIFEVSRDETQHEGLDWSSYDPSWDMNSSILPESCSTRTATAVPMGSMNVTMWDTQNQCDYEFNFLKGMLVTENYMEYEVTRNQEHLISPHSIAYLENLSIFLVSEPDYNRIGAYEKDTFKIRNWLKYPKYLKIQQKIFKHPTNIHSLSNGDVVIVEWNRIHVLDLFLRPLEFLPGDFYGLAEASDLEFLSICRKKFSLFSGEIW